MNVSSNDKFTLEKQNEINNIKSISEGLYKSKLIKWTKEEDTKFEWRRTVTPFVDFLTPSIIGLRSMILSEGLSHTVQDENFLNNVDGEQTNLSSMLQLVLLDAIRYGLSFIVTHTDEIQGVNSKEHQKHIRGYLKHYSYTNLVSRKIKDNKLTQIVFKTVSEIDVDKFETKEVELYKVYFIGGGETWLKDGSDYKLINTWSNNLDRIPINIVYAGDKHNLLDSKSLYRNLADLNISHYNQLSGISNITHIASNPIPVIYGTPINKDVIIGVNTPISFSMRDNSGFEWVEITGNSVSIAQTQIDKLENYMIKLSFSMVVDKQREVTATEINQESTKTKSILVSIAESLESAINHSFKDIEDLLSITIGEININKDYRLRVNYSLIEALIKLRSTNNLSLDTMWAILKDDGFVRGDFDVEEELNRLNDDMDFTR